MHHQSTGIIIDEFPYNTRTRDNSSFQENTPERNKKTKGKEREREKLKKEEIKQELHNVPHSPAPPPPPPNATRRIPHDDTDDDDDTSPLRVLLLPPATRPTQAPSRSAGRVRASTAYRRRIPGFPAARRGRYRLLLLLRTRAARQSVSDEQRRR